MRRLLFVVSAAVAALAIYVVVHDIAPFCNGSIEPVSVTLAGAFGIGWVTATLRDVVKFWL